MVYHQPVQVLVDPPQGCVVSEIQQPPVFAGEKWAAVPFRYLETRETYDVGPPSHKLVYKL